MNSKKYPLEPTDTSLRAAAIIAGLGLLFMAILAPIVEFNVFQKLIIPGDATRTAENILVSTAAFRMGAIVFLIVAILDVVVAWALYILFKPVNQSLSLLAAWLRIIYAAILAISLNNLFNVLQLLTVSGYSALAKDQVYTQVLMFASAFRNGWNIGLVLFGLHLVILGYLAFRSGYVPKWLGLLVIVAGFGYLFDSFRILLLPDLDFTIAQFTFIGEVLLIFWLFWKGIKGFDRELDRHNRLHQRQTLIEQS